MWEGWGPGVEPGTRSSFALDGKPLPFVPYVEFAEEFAGFRTGRDLRMRRFQDKGRAANPAAAVKARIEVEKFRGPLLVVGGHDDQVWASGMMAQNIAERRAAAGLETVALIFPEAGHFLSGNGWMPTTVCLCWCLLSWSSACCWVSCTQPFGAFIGDDRISGIDARHCRGTGLSRHRASIVAGTHSRKGRTGRHTLDGDLHCRCSICIGARIELFRRCRVFIRPKPGRIYLQRRHHLRLASLQQRQSCFSRCSHTASQTLRFT